MIDIDKLTKEAEAHLETLNTEIANLTNKHAGITADIIAEQTEAKWTLATLTHQINETSAKLELLRTQTDENVALNETMRKDWFDKNTQLSEREKAVHSNETELEGKVADHANNVAKHAILSQNTATLIDNLAHRDRDLKINEADMKNKVLDHAIHVESLAQSRAEVEARQSAVTQREKLLHESEGFCANKLDDLDRQGNDLNTKIEDHKAKVAELNKVWTETQSHNTINIQKEAELIQREEKIADGEKAIEETKQKWAQKENDLILRENDLKYREKTVAQRERDLE